MNTERIKQLEKFIQEDPSDPFNHYALSLELKDEEPQRAIQILLTLIREHPHYLPTHYQAAVLLMDENRLDETKIILEKGIKEARLQGDRKAQLELKALQDELD